MQTTGDTTFWHQAIDMWHMRNKGPSSIVLGELDLWKRLGTFDAIIIAVKPAGYNWRLGAL